MIKTNQRRISILIAMLVLCWGVAGLAVAEIAVKDGQRIAFLGDSITAKGRTGRAKLDRCIGG